MKAVLDNIYQLYTFSVWLGERVKVAIRDDRVIVTFYIALMCT